MRMCTSSGVAMTLLITTQKLCLVASIDGGQTYGDKVNLSNSTGSNSTDFDVEVTIDNVIVSWWETNQTALNR